MPIALTPVLIECPDCGQRYDCRTIRDIAFHHDYVCRGHALRDQGPGCGNRNGVCTRITSPAPERGRGETT